MGPRQLRLALSLSSLVLGALGLVAESTDVLAADSVTDAAVGVADIVVQSGRLSVSVQRASLADVLQVIAERAGVEIVLRGNLATPLTESFRDLPLEEGIKRLVRWHSVILFYGPSSRAAGEEALVKMWVIDSASPGAAHTDAAAQRVPPVSVGTDSRDPDLQSRQPLPIAAGPITPTEIASNPSFNRGSGATPPVAIASTIHSAAERIKSLEALLMEHGVEAVEALREAATTDPTPQVRLAAIRALASMNTRHARDALGDALTDRDAVVREAATRAFERSRNRVP